MSPSVAPVSGWKGYALRITVLAIGVFGIYYALLCRRKGSSGGKWNLQKNRKTAVESESRDANTEIKEIKYHRFFNRNFRGVREMYIVKRAPEGYSIYFRFRGSDDRPLVTYNDEICPICLGAPEIGVKASCGHLLCAECLANYCDVTIKPAPLPCPLCRAPLNSIALACDYVGITLLYLCL
ncbi:uncharacterized protein LOC105279182 [Ooceraea biroi]|uniref:uncharacterized protein LOC105279182 n=1 Tax=Ooceraea biroi TaxID=2015173 RepID=UPI0005B7C8B0|nr:uncharacterized protein LOC105279182 [Ooceraea biroi]